MIDVLIIGSGGAGLCAALEAKEAGASVTVAGKGYPTRSQSCMAQGGINAALGNVEEDSVAAHIANTLKSAHGLADETMVTRFCNQAHDAMRWLDCLGMPFSRLDNGKIAQRKLGGASARRACYAQDYTGLKILHTLYDRAIKEGIGFLDEHFLLNLIVTEGRIGGATFLDIRNGEVKALSAKTVIVTTGGYGMLYRGFTTNSTQATGDGVAAAIRAGCKLSDMEFVQFHPTALKSSGVLISESARGEGGYLLNSKEERFVDELRPRDEVAKAIYEEIEKGEAVFLDIRHLGEAFIDENLPQERKLAQLYENVDPVKALIPIKPVAHYSMGGIDVDARHETCIEGLFAAGECANAKVHGANRLGGNSLLELVVFGREAGANAAAKAQTLQPSDDGGRQLAMDRRFVGGVYRFSNQIDFYEKRAFMGKIFYRNAGVLRQEMGLKGVLAVIRQMQKELPFMGITDKSQIYNTNLVEFIEFGNMVELAEIVLVCAISRTESRGAHQRTDFPTEDPRFLAHTVAWKEDGVLCADFKEFA